MKEGDIIDAEVVTVKDGGVYLRAEGLSGFINVTELTWRPGLVDPHSFARVGEPLRVKIYAVTDAGFYASLKALNPEANPYANASDYVPGAIFEATVEKVAPFGVFVLLSNGAIGLMREGAGRALVPGDPLQVEVVSFEPTLKKLIVRALSRETPSHEL